MSFLGVHGRKSSSGGFFFNYSHSIPHTHSLQSTCCQCSWLGNAQSPFEPSFVDCAKFRKPNIIQNALTMLSTHTTFAFDKVNIHSTIPRQHNSAQQRCVKLELVNVISMILFPHDLITPDADCTPCTPSLPRTRMKGHVYLLFVNTNTFGMPISCRRKLKRPRTPWLSNDALKPDQGQSP